MHQENTFGLTNAQVSLQAFENGLYHIHFISPTGFSLKFLVIVR
jgi:hypothetical protein